MVNNDADKKLIDKWYSVNALYSAEYSESNLYFATIYENEFQECMNNKTVSDINEYLSKQAYVLTHYRNAPIKQVYKISKPNDEESKQMISEFIKNINKLR